MLTCVSCEEANVKAKNDCHRKNFIRLQRARSRGLGTSVTILQEAPLQVSATPTLGPGGLGKMRGRRLARLLRRHCV